MSKPTDVGSIRVGGYIIIDGEPCHVVDIAKSKPGKHGSAKARIVAVGVFDNTKRTLVRPVDSQCEIPIIEKRAGQVIALQPSSVQVMDLENYEMLDAPVPEDAELKNKLASGTEVEYWRILGKVKIMRTKG